MLTVRDATKLLSIHLGVDVEPYAAKLVREGWLPRGSWPIDERGAAYLLLGVAGTANPFRATEALERLASVPLRSVEHAFTGPYTLMYQPVPQWVFDATPPSAVDMMVEAMRAAADINWVTIHDGGDVAVFEVSAPPNNVGKIIYTDRGRSERAGFRLTQLFADDISVVVDALRPEEIEPRRLTHPASLALH